MSSQRSWFCDGVAKDGKQYPNCSGAHEPFENYGPDCAVCGLPKEAMLPGKAGRGNQTVLSGGGGRKFPFVSAIAIALLLLLLGGVAWYLLKQREQVALEGEGQPEPASTETSSRSPLPGIDPFALVSETAVNPQLISQGEKILLSGSRNVSEKTTAANSFSQKNWDEAAQLYQQAVDADANDPEAKIYFNNAKAKQAGNPLTIAVVVPIAPSPDEAKEILRGVGLYQDEFNQSPTVNGQLLEVVIVNDDQTGKAGSIAQDLIGSSNVLGVIGHGVDSNSQAAIARYDTAGMAVLSPISTSVTTSGGQSTLKTLSITEKANELLGTYLESVGTSLANYAAQNAAPATVAIFYNSDSPYSSQLKDKFSAALNQVNGQVIQAVDITTAGFDANQAISNAKQAGANVAFLALSKNKVNQAIAIAQANANQSPSLVLIGGDELYNPTLLKEGDAAIEGLVLAVPWSWQPSDPFAQQASNLWKGRISWRTATARDATQALVSAATQNPDRVAIKELLDQGISISGTATNFNLFNQIPLVKAVPGTAAGYRYQFDPL